MILAIETATKSCSAALLHNSKLVAHCTEFSDDFKHAERLHVIVDTLLKENSIAFKDLTGIAVSKGPGSYTGLRIGVSSAKGYSYTLGIPLYAFSPLQMMALQAIEQYNIGPEKFLISMIDARRDEVFMQVFNGLGQPISEVSNHIVEEEFFIQYAQHFLVGDGAEKFKTWDTKTCVIIEGIRPSAHFLAKEGAIITKEDVAYFEPFYLKDFVATTPKKLI